MSLLSPALDDLARRAHVAAGLARAVVVSTAVRSAERLLHGPTSIEPAAEAEIRRRMIALLEEDWRDVREGLVPASALAVPWREYAAALPRFLRDLPGVVGRVRAGRTDDLDPRAAPWRYPRYYARNFHFQSEGWLGHDSARLYDLQVEVLFGGTADVMRRRLIPPVVRFVRGLPTHLPPRILDVACGTGRLLGMLGAAVPGARLHGVDLSPHYVAHARTALPRELDVSLVAENAEALPFPDAHFDATTCLYLFHELPPEVRTRVMAELARVTRPGGLVVVGDTLQLGDAPALDAVLRLFPERYHEPYYLSFLRESLAARMEAAGLEVREVRQALFTKVAVAVR